MVAARGGRPLARVPPMSEAVVNVGIIGCGRISGHHCRSVRDVDGASLVAVCDLQVDRAEAYRDEFGAAAFSDYRRMLTDHPEIDTVVVATPSGMHFEHAIELMVEHGRNVIVEKPTFMRPSQVAEAYDTARRHGVQLFAIFQNRYNHAVQRVRAGIDSGELGSVRAAAVRVRWCRPQRYYDLAPWRGTFAMDGGCLTNQGIHHVDLLRTLGGEVSRVCSTHRTMGAEIEVEDLATAVLEFESGALGTLEVTTAARHEDYEASVSLVCENGLAQIGGIAVNELQVYSPDPDACDRHSEDFSGNIYGKGHLKAYREIVAALRGDDPYPIPEADVASTIRLLNAFYVSAESGRWVDVNSAGDSARLGESDEQLAGLYRTVR